MSRKKKPKVEAAPESEVLAEGSGPVASEVVVQVGVDAIAGADVGELAAAASSVGIEAIARHEDPAEAGADASTASPGDARDPAVDVEDAAGAAEPVEAGGVEAATLDALEEISDEEAEELGATLPTSAASMDALQLKYLVESLVFASDKPITIQRLRQLTRVGDVRRLEQALTDLGEDYRERGIVLQQVSGGYQFRTRTQFSSWVQQLIAGRPVRLSRAQLETLAIVAYRQPITRPEIDEIRGVDSSATLKLLLDRSLIRILGKKEEVGRPMLYGTTKEFLDFFSLGDLRELPTLREYSELTDESRRVMTDRLGIDPDAPDEPPPVEADAVAEPVPTIDDMVASYSLEMGSAITGDAPRAEADAAGPREDLSLHDLATRRLASQLRDGPDGDAGNGAQAGENADGDGLQVEGGDGDGDSGVHAGDESSAAE